MPQALYVSAQAGSGGAGTQSDPYGSIQEAIDAAEPGTVINVMAGTYVENVVFRRDQGGTEAEPITLVSVDGPSAAVIRPSDPGKDTINIDGADNIVVTGFELHGSNVESEQVVHIHHAGGSDPAENITIDGNVIFRGAGDGIKGSKASDITITNNTITGGGDSESGIDLVGVTMAVIEGNSLIDLGNRGIMIKGGSSDIAIIGNTITGSANNSIEIGGYTQSHHYAPGFLDDGNRFEAFNILLSGNVITDCGDTALRLIGAQQVQISDNVITGTGASIKIDDSSKFHEPWFSDMVGFSGNNSDWVLRDRSDHAQISWGTQAKNVFEPWDGLFEPDQPADVEYQPGDIVKEIICPGIDQPAGDNGSNPEQDQNGDRPADATPGIEQRFQGADDAVPAEERIAFLADGATAQANDGAAIERIFGSADSFVFRASEARAFGHDEDFAQTGYAAFLPGLESGVNALVLADMHANGGWGAQTGEMPGEDTGWNAAAPLAAGTAPDAALIETYGLTEAEFMFLF